MALKKNIQSIEYIKINFNQVVYDNMIIIIIDHKDPV